MLKIATHDSVTGEKSRGFLSKLIVPFAKTQSKTIAEQYKAGCRSFDIRVKKVKGEWLCAHGLWKAKRPFADIINEIALFEDRCQVSITYEGKAEYNEELLELIRKCKCNYRHIIWGYIAVKYGKDSNGVVVKYDIIDPGQKGYEGGDQGFVPLDGRSWHTFIPIPWLWNKLFTTPHKFNEERFTFVDFL